MSYSGVLNNNIGQLIDLKAIRPTKKKHQIGTIQKLSLKFQFDKSVNILNRLQHTPVTESVQFLIGVRCKVLTARYNLQSILNTFYCAGFFFWTFNVNICTSRLICCSLTRCDVLTTVATVNVANTEIFLISI